MTTYGLPGVKANVRLAANEVGTRNNISTILGVGARANASDHPKGLALDFMCDLATGDRVKADLIANWDRYGVNYLIHRQQIKESKNGPWTRMEDRGSPTANHMDHVHASFNNVAANTGNAFVGGDPNAPWNENPEALTPANPLDAAVTGIGDALSFLTDGDNWVRMGLVASGTLLVSIVGYQLMKGGI